MRERERGSNGLLLKPGQSLLERDPRQKESTLLLRHWKVCVVVVMQVQPQPHWVKTGTSLPYADEDNSTMHKWQDTKSEITRKQDQTGTGVF
jgi:hypothetical protein